MDRFWKIKPHDEQLISSIERTANVSSVIAQILALRGITERAAIRQFIDTPFQDLRAASELPGIDRAAEAIYRAVRSSEKIVIYGDYDADGMTATAILVRCIRLLGGQVTYYVPNRLDDGYGLNANALKKIADQGASLVVTVDCGIASLDEAKLASSLGLDLIVTDHHQFGAELPGAAAIVHPSLPGSNYPFAGLCGAGIALKLAWRICQLASGTQKVCAAHRHYLLVALGLAAIGTICDVVPLLDENRLIVKHGLSFLKNETVPGLNELMKLTGLDQRPALSAEDIGYSLGPNLNAAGRLGQAQLGVELLTTDSDNRAAALAEYIYQLNKSRDSLERKISKAANQIINQHHYDNQEAIVLAGRDWHAGVVGIVAGRIAEKYNRPTIIISQEEFGGKAGKGSARTACNINLYDALGHCSDLLVSWGGHRQAAGLRIEDGQVDAFRDKLCEFVASHTAPADIEPVLDIDLEVPLSHLTLDTVDQIEMLAPFGEANPRPVFCACGVGVLGPPRKIGGGDRHLSLRIGQHEIQMRSIAFGRSEWADALAEPGKRFDFAFQPMINHFRGRRSVELRLLDWRPERVATTTVGSAVV